MDIVPKNKRVYIGSRRFVEGDLLPPGVQIVSEIPTFTKEEVIQKTTQKAKAKKKTGRRKYNKRKSI
jgi:hypothetical protein